MPETIVKVDAPIVEVKCSDTVRELCQLQMTQMELKLDRLVILIEGNGHAGFILRIDRLERWYNLLKTGLYLAIGVICTVICDVILRKL